MVRLIMAHDLGAFFAYTVYVKFSALGGAVDCASYFNGFGEDLNSTLLVHGIYSIFCTLLSKFLAPMFLGLVLDVVTWHKFRDAQNVTNNWHITLKGLKCKYYSS